MSRKCKVFVGGLSLDTDNDSLKAFFAQFGDIADAIVMRDGATRKSRGFGFVTFADTDSMEACLRAKPHNLDGKDVETKIAVPKEESFPTDSKTKKVFLGGLAPETTKDDIREVIEEFGEVQDVVIMTEKETEKPRGFGFAIFYTFEGADKLCEKKYHRIKDREVEVKKAVSQEDMRRGGSATGMGKSRANNGEAGYGGGRGSADPYSRYKPAAYPGMDYRMQGYEYQRGGGGYDYMRPDYAAAGYGMYDRGAGGYSPYAAAASYRYNQQAYDMAGYNMYPTQGSMGAYQQTPSNYGPSRGAYGGGADKEKERGGVGGRGGGGYHPYRR